MVAEDYIHRIGRTGRNGMQGEALSLVSSDEAGLLRQIQRLLKTDVVMDVVEGFSPSRPIRMDGPMPPINRGGNQRPGGNGAPRKPSHRPHGKPADRGAHAHAGQKPHRGGAARPGSERRDSRA